MSMQLTHSSDLGWCNLYDYLNSWFLYRKLWSNVTYLAFCKFISPQKMLYNVFHFVLYLFSLPIGWSLIYHSVHVQARHYEAIVGTKHAASVFRTCTTLEPIFLHVTFVAKGAWKPYLFPRGWM